MNVVRRLGMAAVAAILAVGVLGSSTAIAKDTSWTSVPAAATKAPSHHDQVQASGRTVKPMDTSWT